MKRLPVLIENPNRPEQTYQGYVLQNEIGSQAIAFFLSRKTPLDEPLRLTVQYGEPQVYEICVTHLHEQISSGRVMNAIPEPNQPFPARTFYRCFAKVLKKIGAEAPLEAPSEAPQVPDAADNVTPITAAATGDAAAPSADSVPASETPVPAEEQKAA